MTVIASLWISSRVIFPVLRKLSWRAKGAKTAKSSRNDQLLLHQEFNSVRNTVLQDPSRHRQKTPQDYTTPEHGQIGGMTLSCFKPVLAESSKTARFNDLFREAENGQNC